MDQRLTSPRTLALVFSFCHATLLLLNVACVKLPRRIHATNTSASTTQTQETATLARGNKPAPSQLIDINRATREELARLPGIGEGFAARIVEHRARYGAFRRAEHLLMVRGISERRFARLRPYITVE
ncbi:MAG: competence protein ComEA [Acidobacteriota bacterium]|nr:competence protein ComEA [Acidobacteriota bacterium]